MPRKLVAYFFHTGWGHFSLGFHVSLSEPNVEIHLPFGFLRLGWETYLIASMHQLRQPPPVFGLRRNWTQTEVRRAWALWDGQKRAAGEGEEPVAAAS
jgi:hypothetical protein